MPGMGRAQGGGSGGFRPGSKPGPKPTSGKPPRIRKKKAKAAAAALTAAAALVQRQHVHSAQQQGEVAGASGIPVVCKMPSQCVAAQTAAQHRTAATAAELQATQRGKLTAFFEPQWQDA